MKLYRPPSHPRRRRGFSLVEAALSILVMSFGFLSLAPLLAVGLTHARVARENRASAEIAATLFQEAKESPFTTGSIYLDSMGNACSSAAAAFVVQPTSLGVNPDGSAATGAAPLTHLTLQIAPRCGPVRIYADVFPTPP